MTQYSDELGEVMRELTSLILSEENLDATLQRVAELSARVLPDCEAGVLLWEKGAPSSPAVTSDLVMELDDIQRGLGDGPCLTAIRDKAEVDVQDVISDERWPRFVEAASEKGIKSIHCFPLIVRDEALGALNFFSREADGFNGDSQQMCRMFAAQAAVSIHNSQLYMSSVKLSDQLTEALESRAVIDQAKGILMEREKITAAEAFEMLRQTSQKVNVKVRDIAHQIVERTEPTPP